MDVGARMSPTRREVDETLAYELELARLRWRGVLQRSDEGILVLDRDGKIVEHNQRVHDLLDLGGSGSLLGRALAPLLPRELAELARCAVTGEELSLRVEFRGKWLELEGRALRVPSSGRLEMLILVRDQTELRVIAERDARIQADLEQAAQFQRALLARTRAPRGLDLQVAYRPLDRVGGDIYDVSVLADGTVRLFIADATGHGVTAALGTMLIKSEYDAIKTTGDSPAMALGALNERITRTYSRLAVMFTAAIVDIAPDYTELRHSSGGHLAPVLHRGDEIVELEEGGPFVGAMPRQRFPEWSTYLDDWRSLTLVTDGVIEARSATGEQFGERRLHAAIAEASRRSSDIPDHVLACLDGYLGTQRAADDITLLAIRPDGR